MENWKLELRKRIDGQLEYEEMIKFIEELLKEKDDQILEMKDEMEAIGG